MTPPAAVACALSGLPGFVPRLLSRTLSVLRMPSAGETIAATDPFCSMEMRPGR